ncbi:MAG: S41 family peptidase [Bdellovibrionales bacterium]
MQIGLAQILIGLLVLGASPVSASMAADAKLEVLRGIDTFVRETYSLRMLKAEKGLRSENLFDHCRHFVESSIGDLDFSDQVRRCVATLNDAHARVQDRTPRPEVILGFSVIEIRGKFYVSSLNAKWREFMIRQNSAFDQIFYVGAELLEFDGRPIRDEIDRIQQYVPASTLRSRRAQVLELLTRRNFLYPKAKHVSLRTAGGDFSTLWWSAGPAFHTEGRKFLSALGIENFNRIDPLVDGPDRDRLNWIGFTDRSPLSGGVVRTFLDKGFRAGLRIGVFSASAKQFCYLQLLTFERFPNWVSEDNGSVSRYEKPIVDHLTFCKASNLPLVVDLRSNQGGDTSRSELLYSFLVEKGAPRSGVYFSGLMTESFSRLVQEYDLGDGFPKSDEATSQEGRRLRAMSDATEAGASYPRWALDNIFSGPGAGTFDGKIAILTSPRCVSACELFVDLVRRGRRGLIVGGPTEGTGGRTLSFRDDERFTWLDQRFGSVKVSVPNSLYVVSETLAKQPLYFEFDTLLPAIREGVGIPPSAGHEYTTHLEDLNTGGAGWLRAAEAAL